jgi:hypothetical protein
MNSFGTGLALGGLCVLGSDVEWNADTGYCGLRLEAGLGQSLIPVDVRGGIGAASVEHGIFERLMEE